ncbi:GatB/YqeY domain-containing protein [Nocardia sp. IFM 10818]
MSAESSTGTAPLRDRLRAALPTAMKARDKNATAALRSALAAIDNAEAVDGSDMQAGAIESSPAGLGTAERPRRDLTEADIEAIVRTEIADRLTAAAEYAGRGSSADDRAAALRAEAAALEAHIAD